MPIGAHKSDLTLEDSAPVMQVLARRTEPAARQPYDASAWRLISQLSLNYLSLAERGQGAAALRELLRLYGDSGDPALQLQIEGLRGGQQPTLCRGACRCPPTVFGRGLITLDFDENAFRGTGESFSALCSSASWHATCRSTALTETVLRTGERAR